MTQPKNIDDLASTMAGQMAEYQQMVQDNIKKYEAMVAKASSDLEKLVQAANPAPPEKPEAQWTEAEGQRLLILNVAAAEFFQTIFEQVGVLATELGKMANSENAKRS